MRIVVCLVVVLGCVFLAKETNSQCPNGGFHECYYHHDCIPNYMVCDGKEDCDYGDDEVNCRTAEPTTWQTTEAATWRTTEGTTWQTNEATTWQTTEATTAVYTTEHTTEGSLCPEGQYECLTGLCIPDTWVCDGTADCPDYGDDEHCFKTGSIRDTCPKDTYRCNYNGQCVPNSSVCDGVKDCPEYGDDEAGCTTDTRIPPYQKLECRDNFDYIYDRCVLVDPFTATNWDEARYLCEKFSSDLVVLNDYNFYAELLQYIRDKGLDSYNYWVGATDQAAEGTWLWVDSSPVPSRAPLWALYGCTGDYQLEPRTSDAAIQDCGFLDIGRGLHMSDASCDESFAPICQASSTKKETRVKEPIEKE